MSNGDVVKKENSDPKPKPIAKLEVIVLDSGDLEIDCMEYVPTGVRGRPKAWRLPVKEFVRVVESQVGTALQDLRRFLPGATEEEQGTTTVE